MHTKSNKSGQRYKIELKGMYNRRGCLIVWQEEKFNFFIVFSTLDEVVKKTIPKERNNLRFL